MRVYLDNCCFGRPLDDQSQERVRVEADAVLEILQRCQHGEWLLVCSAINYQEMEDIPDLGKRDELLPLLPSKESVQPLSLEWVLRATQLRSLGFSEADSLHVAAAEALQADIFLTTDDRLLKRIGRLGTAISVRGANPVEWLREVTHETNTG